MSIHPNAYYNYRKNRKDEYRQKLALRLEKVGRKFHDLDGTRGYRQVCDQLKKDGLTMSYPTCHKYLNKLLGLKSIQRKRKPVYEHGDYHQVLENILNQNFKAERKNEKWCMDFTYVALKDGTFRYNCTIIDLFDRSVIASENSRQINTELAIRTMLKGIESQDEIDTSRLIIHTDQGCQFTSSTFQFFCNNRKIRQSMSRAGYPYDNAPMERYFNTLKTELLNVHEYSKEKDLYKAINDFAYIWYNQNRTHTYNNHRTPYEVRFAA